MKESDGDELNMTLWEHLAELRRRLLKVVIATLVLGVGALFFAKPIFGLLMRPVLQALPAGSRSLVYTSGIEELNVLMKVGLYAGIFLTTPVILWQLWGFVSPGLYANERRLAGPFVVLGTLAFLAGAAFCYFAILPTMFQFLLQEGDSAALEQRIARGRLEEGDALRLLALGDPEKAGALAKSAMAKLSASGDGQATSSNGPLPSLSSELEERLAGMGRMLDAGNVGFPPSARPVLKKALEKRMAAVEAFGREDLKSAAAALEEAAALLAGASGSKASDLSEVWKLEKDLARGRAHHQALAWTRPMLTMQEQLSLVLLLELALGIIFELPLVMALLALAGLVNAKTLFRYQRHALVLCLIAAAIITPTGDAVNLALMAVPMLLCYEVGVVAVWWIERTRAKKLVEAVTP